MHDTKCVRFLSSVRHHQLEYCRKQTWKLRMCTNLSGQLLFPFASYTSKIICLELTHIRVSYKLEL